MGIKDLRVTTAERPDYELMMQQRGAVLRQNNIKLQQMFKVVERLEPLDGAKKFLQWLKEAQEEEGDEDEEEES